VRRGAAHGLAEEGVTRGEKGVTVGHGGFYSGAAGWGMGGGGRHTAAKSGGRGGGSRPHQQVTGGRQWLGRGACGRGHAGALSVPKREGRGR
jgi:hypothetical protein